MSRKLRVLYAAGPGDVIGTYGYWSQGKDDPSQVSITYSGQFYQVCSNLGAQAYIISSNPKQKFLRDGAFTLEHRPVPLLKQTGILYHLGQIGYGLSLIFSAICFRADVVVLGDITHYFVMSLLPLLGIQVIPSLHCVLWCKYLPPSKTEKLLLKLNRRFFAQDCLITLAVSADIADQVREITNYQPSPILTFLSSYRRREFEQVSEPDPRRSPFRILFAGRIERDKGVFDLLEIAKRFKAEGRTEVVFDICGTGSASEELQQQIEQAGVGSTVIYYGHCNKEQMRQRFERSHGVIVPTRTNFVEGMNKVVVEAVLAGRPVITSAVCPALSYVRAAVMEVPPDDVKAYGDAIIKLYTDQNLYAEKRANCLELQEPFYDSSRSWGMVLQSVLSAFSSTATSETPEIRQLPRTVYP